MTGALRRNATRVGQEALSTAAYNGEFVAGIGKDLAGGVKKKVGRGARKVRSLGEPHNSSHH